MLPYVDVTGRAGAGQCVASPLPRAVRGAAATVAARFSKATRPLLPRALGHLWARVAAPPPVRQRGHSGAGGMYTASPILPHFGAEVRGFSLDGDEPLPKELIQQIKEDMNRYRVLVFKGQGQLSGLKGVGKTLVGLWYARAGRTRDLVESLLNKVSHIGVASAIAFGFPRAIRASCPL